MRRIQTQYEQEFVLRTEYSSDIRQLVVWLLLKSLGAFEDNQRRWLMGGRSLQFRIGFLTMLALGVSLCAAVPLRAQAVGATLTGTVSDPSGGAIARATISSKNLATGLVREVISDSAGFYTLPNLAPGTYTVTVTASGFSTAIRSDFTVTVGENRELNVTMQVGQVEQRVEVTGEAPAVQTTSSEISAVVNSETIVELPLNGRSWTDLTVLQRGVSVIGTGEGEAEAGFCNHGCGNELAINGSRPQQNSYRIDGMSINDQINSAPGSQAGGGNLGVDTIREFSVITDNQPAEYGRESGGVINSVTRSGTNEFHGTAFEFVRNNAFDARNFFDPAKIPAFRRNQFGGSVGGPVQKGKTFFFFSYEGLRQTQPTTLQDRVITSSARAGDVATGKDPNTGLPCPCTITVSPAILLALKLMPLPNFPSVANPTLITPDQGIFAFTSNEIIGENFYDARIDRTFSAKDSVAGTYQFDRAAGQAPDGMDVQIQGNITQRQLATIAETHVFSSALVNTARFGWTHFAFPIGIGLGAINPAANNPASATVPGVPGQAAISIGSGFTSIPGGVGSQAASFSFWETWQYYDDLFLTKGKHSLKFGFAAEHDQQNYNNSTATGGSWSFNGLPAFLLDQPTSLTAQVPGHLLPRLIHQTIFGGYVQDDFRFRPGLTLNLGLRYEMSTGPNTLQGRASNLRNIYDANPVLGGPWWKNPTYRNFEPRVGFAWDPFHDGKSSVRGGFGMFDVLPLYAEITTSAIQGYPFAEAGTAAFNGKADVQGYFPTIGYNCCLAANPKSFRGINYQYNPKRNYIMQWDLDLQHQLTPSLSISAGYVGKRGVHMVTSSEDPNIVEPTLTSAGWLWPGPFGAPGIDTSAQRINPNFGSMRGRYWLGDSAYHGLVVDVEKRMAQGFYIRGSFTWQKSLDDTSTTQDGDSFTNSIGFPDLFDTTHAPYPTFYKKLWYGRSDFNIGRTLIINGVWDIPAPKSTERLVTLVAKGWEMSGIFTVHDGQPFTPTWGTSGNVTGSFGSGNNGFVDQLHTPGCSNPINPQNPVNYIKASCFTLPVAPTMAFWTANCDPLLTGTIPESFPTCVNLEGNSGRNVIVGPGLADLDFAMMKNTYVTERLNIQFRAEAFNIANRANFSPPGTDIFDSTGALIPSVGRISTTTTKSREIQFALKLIF
jgi:hypothetical protein